MKQSKPLSALDLTRHELQQLHYLLSNLTTTTEELLRHTSEGPTAPHEHNCEKCSDETLYIQRCQDRVADIHRHIVKKTTAHHSQLMLLRHPKRSE